MQTPTVFAIAFILAVGFRLPAASLVSVHVHEAGDKSRAIEGKRDAAKALTHLDELQDIDEWILMGGIGPIDKVYATTLALVLFKSFLPWDTAAWNAITPTSSSQIQKWICTDPRAEDAMLAMLGSDNPVARRIAVDKLRNSLVLTPEIVSKLKHLVDDDDYIIVGNRPLTLSSGERAEVRAFSAPLRRDIAELLKLAGEGDIRVDEGKLIVDGLAWLGRESFARVAERREIIEALSWLTPIAPIIRAARKEAKEARTEQEQLTLFRRLAAMRESTLDRSLLLETVSSIAALEKILLTPTKPELKTPPTRSRSVEVFEPVKSWPLRILTGCALLTAIAVIAFMIIRRRPKEPRSRIDP